MLPFMAMLEGGDDLQTGLVFAQNIYVKQNQASFGSLNSYTAKLFNVSDTMDMLVNNTSLIEIHGDGSEQAQNSSLAASYRIPHSHAGC